MNQNNYMTYMVTYVSSQTNNLRQTQKVVANARIEGRSRIQPRGEFCIKNAAFFSKITILEHRLFTLGRLTTIARKKYRPCVSKK